MSLYGRLLSLLRPAPEPRPAHGPRPPEDWDDHEGWERFYAAHPGRRAAARLGAAVDVLLLFGNDPARFAADLLAGGRSKVWLPGCGLSPVPALLAESGLEVYATDVSAAAVASQRAWYRDGSAPEGTPGRRPGRLECGVHDARSPYLDDFFDLVINARAFAGFNPESMRGVAESHYGSLRPGREALFLIQNAADGRLDAAEDCLAGAGFLLPSGGADRRYRRELREAGIPNAALAAWGEDGRKLREYESITKEYLTGLREGEAAGREGQRRGEKLARIYRLTG